MKKKSDLTRLDHKSKKKGALHEFTLISERDKNLDPFLQNFGIGSHNTNLEPCQLC